MQATPNTPVTAVPTAVIKAQESSEGSGPRQKLRAFTISSANGGNTIEFVLQNDKGLAYDLSNVANPSVSCSVMESSAGAAASNLTAAITDAAHGIVTITPGKVAAGIYKGSVILAVGENKILDNPFMLYVSEPVGSMQGPPTLLEVRLQLRDSSADENYLLDSVAFSDDEIALAAIRPIQYFNEVSPQLDMIFTTQNFPWRYHWIEGMIAQLFMIAAEGYRKNSLQYNAGGLSVADMEKERNYVAAYQEKWAVFMSFVRNKKGELNMESGWSYLPGPYSYIGVYR